MTSEKDLKLVLSVAVILFIVGVLCFAAFPIKSPTIPNRIQYRHYQNDSYKILLQIYCTHFFLVYNK